jgi:UDP-N-acetyl-2-amino-2-deoxyglucuronate dehydrogenase
MTKRINLAVVGCGGIASWLAFLARITPGVQFVAACDIDYERVNIFSRKFRIPCVYTNYAEMLEAGDFDAVYLAVPHNLHFNMLISAVKAGYPILTEKPITRTFAEGQEIVRFAKERSVKLGVNYQYRYDSGCYRLAKAVQTGALGSVLYARINIPWHRERNYFDDSPWHKTLKQAGGGTLITQASHLMDVVLWAVGSSPVSVTGYTDKKVFKDVEVEDFAAGGIEMENGAWIQVVSSMAAATEQPVSIELYGEKGTGIYSNNPWPRVKFVGVKPKTEKPPNWGFHALHRSLKGFRDWVLDGKPYLIPGEESLPVLQVIEAMYQSAKEGCQIKIRR